MSIYSLSGAELGAAYGIAGTGLDYAYDLAGTAIYSAGPLPDYDVWETEYQHAILQARDAWATEYRADSTVIPLIIHTDQHRNLNSTHKPTFDYLARAVRWDEVSAIVGLGDVCGAVYNATDLNNMVSCLSSLPRAKRIDIAGNHDVQGQKTEGSSYAYSPLPDATFEYLQETYFDNSGYGTSVRYGVHGMESVIDEERHIKYCVFAVWYTDGDPWYHYRFTAEAAEAIISMLSANDGCDIVILSHIQPYYRQAVKYIPAVDGNTASESTIYARTGALGYDVALDQLYADRKARRSGSITDVDGVAHSYDFTGCTSDLLCSLSGHAHEDYQVYSPDGTVPALVFDAYRYDNCPLYMVNVDRTRQRVNVWKFDEAANIYNYQVPFAEPAEEAVT